MTVVHELEGKLLGTDPECPEQLQSLVIVLDIRDWCSFREENIVN